MKTIITYDAGETRIELFACALTPEEHTATRRELEAIEDCVIEFIDVDSIRASIMNADYDTVKKLEEKGWTFQ